MIWLSLLEITLVVEWRTDNTVANEESGGHAIFQERNNGGSNSGWFQ